MAQLLHHVALCRQMCPPLHCPACIPLRQSYPLSLSVTQSRACSRPGLVVGWAGDTAITWWTCMTDGPGTGMASRPAHTPPEDRQGVLNVLLPHTGRHWIPLSPPSYAGPRVDKETVMSTPAPEGQEKMQLMSSTAIISPIGGPAVGKSLVYFGP